MKQFCVYKDEKHEEATRTELDRTQVALQGVLDVWNGLDLIPVNDVVSLILNPQTAYGNAVNQLAEPPSMGGRFQMKKQAYIDTLEIPIPDQLYRICKEARQMTFAAVRDLWTIEEGKTIVMNQEEADKFISEKSIFCDPDKEQLAKDIVKFVEVMNMLVEKFPGDLLLESPSASHFFRGKFNIVQKSFPGLHQLEIIPEKFREWLS